MLSLALRRGIVVDGHIDAISESVFENGHLVLVGCQGRGPGVGASRRVMMPIMAQVIIASEWAGSRS